jgi:hypothetical protein
MRFVIYAFLFIGTIHLGNLFYGPIIKNHMLEGKMINLVNEPRLKDDRYMLEDLYAYIDDNHIEVDRNQISIHRAGPRQVTLSAKYEIYRKFWFMEKNYVFTPSSANEAVHGIFPDFAAY